MPALNKFQIDSNDVTGMSVDSKHLLIPDPASKRIEHFPGSRVRYAVKGQPFYGRLLVRGPMRAATPDALYTLIDTYVEASAAVPLVEVTFHTKTWTDCDFFDFRPIGDRIIGYTDASGSGVQIDVLFTFVRLAG